MRWFHIMALSVGLFSRLWAVPQADRPNVVLILLDDLNDWVGCMGGHPQARTPNIDALAQRGVLFKNAHCQAPVCNPSRVSMMMGLRPSTTSVYDNDDSLQKATILSEIPSLPEWFTHQGYLTMGCGKVFHASRGQKRFTRYGPSGGQGPLPDQRLSTTPEASRSKLWDWGTFPPEESQYHDVINSQWAAEQLQKDHEAPLFLTVGLYRPHVPLFAPKRFLDLYPLKDVLLPTVLEDDMEDIPQGGRSLAHNPLPPAHAWFLKKNRWKEAVQAYLASVSFVDACVGRLIKSLDDGPMADHTWVVLLSDHGFFLGEKERWAKQALWERATRVPLIIVPPKSLPESSVRNSTCSAPVELLSLYPTLLDFCQLKHPPHLEGRSLMPLVQSPQRPWPYPAITTFGKGNHSIRSKRWRYTRYADQSEELYDHIADPHEWHNLAPQSEVLEQVSPTLAPWLP